MDSGFTATRSIDIEVPPERVWEALTKPEIVKEYLFGTEVVSDWKVGSPLVYKGEWEGKPYEDKGTILEIEPNRLLKATYYSPSSGLEDKPENYNTVTYALSPKGPDRTELKVTQTNNTSLEAAAHSEEVWGEVLDAIRDLLEV